MSVGTTTTHLFKRNKIVEQALRAVRAIKPGQSPDNNMMRDGVNTLNEIIREEDQDFTGDKTNLHGIATSIVLLTAGVYIYSSSVGGLATDIKDLIDAQYRDRTGSQVPIKFISAEQFAQYSKQNETGDVLAVCLHEDRLLTARTLQVWPVPTSIGTASQVMGSDALNYTCILKHTSDSNNKPVTGSQYRMFWKQTGSSGVAWVTATAYSNQEAVVLTYKQPLFEFTDPDSDPDLQFGWGNYLKWRLAIDLSATFKVPMDERQWFATQRDEAMRKINPNSRVKTQDIHNKAKYF
jgi:hypothetical protein